MPSLVAYAAATCAAASGWLVRGALAIQSPEPGAAKVGLLPPLWELGLFILAGACVVFLLRPPVDRTLPLFSTAVCVLPWLPGVRSPELLVWTGPLGVGAWWGAVATSVLASRRKPVAFSFTPAALANVRSGTILATAAASVFFAVVAFGARKVVPAGDEPHYLVITQSLIEDHDIQIENNHARRDYAAYFAGRLEPHFWRRGQNGAIYSIHAPGLPVVIAPAYLVGGYRGVVVLMVAIAGMAAGLLWRLSYAVTGRASAAWFGLAATVCATPVAFQSFTVFPDGPAGFVVLTGLWALMRVARTSAVIPLGSHRAWVLHGLALALLPWMHTRLAALAGMLALVVLVRMPRNREGLSRAVSLVSMPLLSAVGWFAFFHAIYGTPNPMAPWTRLDTSWSFVPGGLAGMLFDQQFGALWYAPVVVAAVAGWFVLFRSDRRLAVDIGVIVVPYAIVTTRLWIWWAGWSAPARFWTPLFWIGGVTAAVAWRAATTRIARGTALGLLAGSALTTVSLAYAYGGRLAYNERDGYARWFDWLSPLTDLPPGLPSFFRSVEQPSAFALQILIVVALVALAFAILRRADARVRGNGAVALIALLTYAACGMTVLGAIMRLNGSLEPRASVSQLRLLEAARDAHRAGVHYQGTLVRLSGVDELVRQLRIQSPPRLAAGSGAPALVLPGWFSAGTYQLSAAVSAGGNAAYDVRVLRAGPPILQGAGSPSSRQLNLTVRLPVDTPALILRGTGLGSAFLQPVHVATHRERFERDRASNARRYGSTVAWFVDENAYNDPDGIWIKGGGAVARLLLQPDSRSAMRMLVRNGPAPNDVMLSAEAGGWAWSGSLNPGQESEITVPVDPARGVVMLRVISRSAFRPAETNPGSRDTRLLGVWMSPR